MPARTFVFDPVGLASQKFCLLLNKIVPFQLTGKPLLPAPSTRDAGSGLVSPKCRCWSRCPRPKAPSSARSVKRTPPRASSTSLAEQRWRRKPKCPNRVENLSAFVERRTSTQELQRRHGPKGRRVHDPSLARPKSTRVARRINDRTHHPPLFRPAGLRCERPPRFGRERQGPPSLKNRSAGPPPHHSCSPLAESPRPFRSLFFPKNWLVDQKMASLAKLDYCLAGS